MVMEFVLAIVVLALFVGVMACVWFSIKGITQGDIKEDMILQGFTWPVKLATAFILFGFACLIVYISKNT